VAQVNVPSANGEFGVLPNHVPALGVLKPGVVSVYETADAKKEFFGTLRCWC
jgi:F-type H+-transporting ATPase subunit delta